MLFYTAQYQLNPRHLTAACRDCSSPAFSNSHKYCFLSYKLSPEFSRCSRSPPASESYTGVLPLPSDHLPLCSRSLLFLLPSSFFPLPSALKASLPLPPKSHNL